MTYFSLNRLYASISEIELNKGYSDILLLKAPNIKDDIPNILIEFKFFKQKQKVSDELLQQTIEQAKEQIERYRQSSKFSIDRSIVVIFQGFRLLYCEWA
jgi:phosphate starvation-inducible protein PhoH